MIPKKSKFLAHDCSATVGIRLPHPVPYCCICQVSGRRKPPAEYRRVQATYVQSIRCKIFCKPLYNIQ